MIDNIIKVRTLNEKGIVMQKVILFLFIHFGVAYSSIKGEHLSFNFGFGPMEFEWSIRLWLTETR